MNWNDGYVVPVPAGGATGMTAGMDRYYRFQWNQIQNDDGSYNWTTFDSRMQIAIGAGQKFCFGIMPICQGGTGENVGGVNLTYPLFLHTQMQSESLTDWASSDTWIPNWNSVNFLNDWQNMLNAVASHIANTTYNGVAYKNAIGYIDIRGYGNFGEWHNDPYYTSMPSALWPSTASLESVINSHITAFPNYPLVIMIAAYDNHDATTQIPTAVTYYALTAKNNWGPIGWRRDNWGDATNYTAILENNPGSLNGLAFNSAIMSRYQTAPITGEPLNGLSSYSDVVTEVKKYGGSSFGNGNIANATSSSTVSDIQSASFAAGARLQITSGSISSNISVGSAFALTLNWQNVGASPLYESWNTNFELRNGSTVVASWTSSFNPKLFLPGSTTVTDNLTVPSTVSPGNYSLYLIIRDPNGYRKPLPLSISGVNSDGSYLIKAVTVSSSGSSTPPVASAGVNQTITLPTNTVTLTGTLTDLLSVLSSSSWSQMSGPNTATISSPSALQTSVSGLIAGTYVFQINIIDLLGLSATATVTITVNAAPNQPPVVSAGSGQTITLPTNTINLKGTATDASGTITAYAWTQTSGPNTANISSPAALKTSVSGLVAGTYVFTLKVSDSEGLSATSTVTVIVNPVPNIPPVANAGTNQTITLPTNSVTLDGTGSADPDGTIASYKWTKISGPSQGTLSNSGNATATASNLVQGVYAYKLTVTDNDGATGSDTVTITVNAAPNEPPVANAGSNKTITLPTNSVSLDGSNSSDPDGTIAAYSWKQVSGPSTATITNGNTATPVVSGLVAGQYMFQLTVTDNSGATATAQVKIIVNAAPANQPPVANAGTNQTITLPTNAATLDGTGSEDPDGTIASYKWTEISGPSQGTLSNSGNATATASNLVQGVYAYQLVVTDNNGATDADTVTITVNAAPNQPPVANAGSSKTITLPTSSVSLDGSKSSDPDGTIAAYSWKQVSGPSTATITNGNTATPVVSNLKAGQYMFQLTVTDNSGATATAQVKIIVNAAPVNQPPVANAGTNQTITLPTNAVTLDGSGSEDPDGTITTYAWTKISGPSQGTVVNPGDASTLANNLVQGTYSYKLTVTDNDGATGSDTVTITVNAAPNEPPVANAGSNKTITLPTSSVTLDGSKSSDPDGTIAEYNWKQVSGPSSATISNANTATPVVSGLVAGQYTFQLTVTDNSGATATSQVKIIVNAAVINQPPVANAGTNQTITLPVNSVTLDGTGSDDANGTIASYAWKQISGPAQSTIVSAGSATTLANNLVQGTYTYQLLVTDNGGATGADTVTITVNAAVNQPPIANAGSNKTITLPVNSVSLNGSKSSDPDGTIAGYAWKQVSGPSGASISNANTATPVVSGLTAGQYTFQLTVTDNSGATATAQVKIIVNAATVNQPPVANAGNNQTITLPANSVTLDGSGSEDPDGTITSYSWTKMSGPAQGTIVNATDASTLVNTLVQGTYVYILTVTDNDGATGADTVTITVNAASNQPPVANAGSNKTITIPVNSVVLDGSKSSDPDGSIVSYNWIQLSGPSTATIANGNSATAAAGSLLVGNYYFQLTVTDNDGATDNATIKVTVRAAAANLPPVANAGANQIITLPVNSVTLDGAGSADPDGTITSYAWAQLSGPAQSTLANAGSASTLVSNLVQGTYTFKLTVTDNGGATGADTVTVIVNAAANLPPVANAGSSKTITLPVNSVTLDGSKSVDPDGSIVSYSWTQVSGPSTATFSTDKTVSPTVSGLTAGQYVFELTVTDNDGATGQAQVKIVVNAAIVNQPPVANAGADQTITLPVNSVTLDGSKSVDADGTIVSYSWNKISGSGAITITNSNTAKPTVSGLQAGTYVFQLTVTDNTGATGTDNVTITVNPAVVANQPPVANAGTDQTITLPVNSVTLDGSKSSDPDGSIASYSWTKVSGTGGTMTNSSTAKPTVSNLQAGPYTFKLTVTDNKGATASDQVNVTVNAAAAQVVIPPVANAGSDTTIAFPVASILLDGSASTDPGSSIESYEWTQLSGPDTATMASWNTATATAENLEVGVYTFQLTVTNAQGASSSASVNVTVVNNLRTASSESILLYPNPAQSTINLRLLSDSTGNMKVNIVDMTGKVVMVTEMNKTQSLFDQSLNISGLAHGMYTMQVIIGTRISMVSKFLKQ